MNYPDKNFETVAPGVEPQDAERGGTVLDGGERLSSHARPFAHRFSPACLGEAQYQALSQTFPDLALFKPDARRRLDNTVLRISSSRVLAEPEFSSPWKSFVQRHTSARFWEQITQHYASEIRALHPGLEQALGRPVEAWRAVRRGSGETGDVSLECQIVVNTAVTTTPSAVKAPHVDHVNKLWTGLLYMRLPGDDSTGGDLQIYESRGTVQFDAHQAPRSAVIHAADVSYKANAFVGFVNGPLAIHSVSPRAPTQHIRRYVDFVVEMDRPVFRLPQMGLPRRLWFRLFQRERTR